MKTPGAIIVEITIDGEISHGEFDNALYALHAAIDQHGSLRLLKHIKSLSVPPVPWSKLWDDVKFGFDHLTDITHVAVVADHNWIATLGRFFFAPLLRAKVKTFDGEQLEVARNWLRSAG